MNRELKRERGVGREEAGEVEGKLSSSEADVGVWEG